MQTSQTPRANRSGRLHWGRVKKYNLYMAYSSFFRFLILFLTVCFPFLSAYASGPLKTSRFLKKAAQPSARFSVSSVREIPSLRLAATVYQHSVVSVGFDYTPPVAPQHLTSLVERAILRQRVFLPELPALKPLLPDWEQIDAVIFDLDGTLLDSLAAWEHSGTNYLRSQGITPAEWLDEELAKMSLLDGANLVKEMYNLPEEAEEILRRTLAPIYKRYATDLPLKPGVAEMLFHLKSLGIKLCVATASDRVLAETALERLGVLPFFDFIITCDEVGVGKRSSAVYEQALKQLGTAKPHTLVVEDAPYALETAVQAGFPTLGVFEPKHGAAAATYLSQTADYYILSFSGILSR